MDRGMARGLMCGADLIIGGTGRGAIELFHDFPYFLDPTLSVAHGP